MFLTFCPPLPLLGWQRTVRVSLLSARPCAAVGSKQTRPLLPCRFRSGTITCAVERSKLRIEVGEIVGVDCGGKIEVAKVTGVDGNGRNADLLMLDQFVPEMYVEGSKAKVSYEPVNKLRKIRSEYVPSQEGWIVLDIDKEACRNEFDKLRMTGNTQVDVMVTEKERRKLSEEALKRQPFPMPTKSQAYFGAALSVPLASLLYAGFASARQSYEANPIMADDPQIAAAFRGVVLILTGGSAAAAVVVGASLLILALTS